jgi:hypothetical protein
MRLDTIEEINAYYEGKKDGIWLFAWWKDSRQYVGSCGQLLSVSISEVMEQQKQALIELHEERRFIQSERHKEKYEPLTCPFCKEEDFDAIGLKYHLLYHCDKFFEVNDVKILTVHKIQK